MKDLNENVEGEKTPDNQNDSKKETTENSVIKKQHVAVKKIIVKPKESPVAAHLANNASKDAVIIAADVNANKETKPTSKKGSKTDTKIADAKPPKMEKTESEIMVQNEADANSKEEQEKPDLDKKEIIIIKKNAKKAEEKVDKLKMKVKKAKKKEVKTSKLNGLKEKLKKALEKLKISIKKLKKVKK